MNVISTRNVHQALPLGLQLLAQVGVVRGSRNGEVLQSPCPVTTVYAKPCERVMFWPARDANPFFHLYEGLWMLGGLNTTAELVEYVPRMGTFSDDGHVLQGAYGARWRWKFGMDQLRSIGAALRKNPDDRRQVLQMWDTRLDLGSSSRDVPCNVTASFQVNTDGDLDLTVFCRSNDIIWGAYGANAVHMSMLQEYVAALVGRSVGRYYQVSVNWHAYTDVLDPLAEGMNNGQVDLKELDAYENGTEPHPLVSVLDPALWEEDLNLFLADVAPHRAWRDPFFPEVAVPLRDAWRAWRRKGVGLEAKAELVVASLERCKAEDWFLAASEWIMRRVDKMTREVDDGVAAE